jgi:hypothetical protein
MRAMPGSHSLDRSTWNSPLQLSTRGFASHAPPRRRRSAARTEAVAGALWYGLDHLWKVVALVKECSDAY